VSASGSLNLLGSAINMSTLPNICPHK
jgi:hypothetical protein